MDELAGGGFREVIGETGPIEAERVTRVLFASGKFYWDLLAAREEKQAEHAALVRLEQLYPFPHAQVQEEPRNMGGWHFVHDRVQPLLAQTRRLLGYIGRPESAATAAGSHQRHLQEQKQILEEAFAPAGAARPSNVRMLRRR